MYLSSLEVQWFLNCNWIELFQIHFTEKNSRCSENKRDRFSPNNARTQYESDILQCKLVVNIKKGVDINEYKYVYIKLVHAGWEN